MIQYRDEALDVLEERINKLEGVTYRMTVLLSSNLGSVMQLLVSKGVATEEEIENLVNRVEVSILESMEREPNGQNK